MPSSGCLSKGLFFSCFLLLVACSNRTENNKYELVEATSSPLKQAGIVDQASQSNIDAPLYNYERLQQLIIYGRASLADVRQAFTDKNAASLSNTMHALYAMRWHRGVINLIYDMWKLEKEKYPEISWELIAKAPVRIALASTINRIQIVRSDEYKDYIRSHKQDKHEFHIAQVVIALGFNGDPEDIDYIQTMADGNDPYIVQSAITSLALMGGNQARDSLAKLWKKYKETSRGDLIEEMLLKAYKVEPSLKKPGEINIIPGEKSTFQGPIK